MTPQDALEFMGVLSRIHSLKLELHHTKVRWEIVRGDAILFSTTDLRELSIFVTGYEYGFDQGKENYI